MDRLGLWILVISVGLAVGVFLLIYLLRQAHRRAWSEMAAQLGLAYEPGRNFWSLPVVTGTYQGHAVVLDTFSRVRGSGNDRSREQFTRMVMTIDNPTDLHLFLNEESVFSRITKLVGVADIQLGDAVLDRRFTIKGRPEEGVRRLLASEVLRQRLLSLRSIDLSLLGTTISYEHRGLEKDTERLRSLLDLLNEFATAVEHAG